MISQSIVSLVACLLLFGNEDSSKTEYNERHQYVMDFSSQDKKRSLYEIKKISRFKVDRLLNKRKTKIGAMVHGNSTTGDPKNYNYYSKDFVNAGLSIVRIEPCDEMYYFQREGVEILAYMSEPKAEILEKYDGHNKFKLGKDSLSCLVKYWEFCNEQDILFWQKKLSIEDIFEKQKKAYLDAKKIRPDIQIVMGAPANITSGNYFELLCNYTDEKGKYIWDYFDIINIHCYPNKPELVKEYFDILQKYLPKNIIKNKGIWMTECGIETLRNTEKQQALFIPKLFLCSLSKGVKNIIYYCYMYSEGLNYYRESELYFGLVHECIDNSFISFLQNDKQINKPISIGEALLYKPIYKGEKSKQISLDKDEYGIINNLKKNGIVIGGEGYVLKKVSIENNNNSTVVWEGARRISTSKDYVRIDNNDGEFDNVIKGDKLVVHFEEPTVVRRDYTKLKPKPSYYSVTTFNHLYVEGSSKPEYKEVDNNLNIAEWYNPDRTRITAMWTQRGSILELKNKPKEVVIYDYLGNVLENDTISLSDNLIYITNIKEAIIKKK